MKNIMKVLSNLFGQNKKINANDIAYKKDEKGITLDTELSDIDTRLTTADGDIDNLKTRVSNNESNITLLMASRMIRGDCTYTASTGQVIINIPSMPLDSGLVVISWHIGSGALGGIFILAISYYASIVKESNHNTSGYSSSISGNTTSGFTLTIKDSNITASSTFTIKFTRTKSYAEN